MKAYRMTEAETQAWESEDARVRDAARKDIRSRVRSIAIEHDEMHEIVADDAVVMDVVYPSSTEAP